MDDEITDGFCKTPPHLWRFAGRDVIFHKLLI
jgi:hypothetical protein